jgi:hypothetical protein
MNVAHHQCHQILDRPGRVTSRLCLAPRSLEAQDAKVTPARGEVTDNLIWITLLVKLGVVASVASVLARVATFRRLFFAEQRRPARPSPCWRFSWCRSPSASGCALGAQLSRRRHLF